MYLWFTGANLLRQKMRNGGVTQFKADTISEGSMGLFIPYFASLTDLILEPCSNFYHYDFAEIEDDFELTLAPEVQLRRLKLWFGDSFQHPLFTALLPHLSHLQRLLLSSKRTLCPKSVDLISKLPLLEFELLADNREGAFWTDPSKLPRSLTILHITGGLTWRNDLEYAGLPPMLETLVLDMAYTHHFTVPLPPTLTTFELRLAQFSGKHDIAITAKEIALLPRSLKKLFCQCHKLDPLALNEFLAAIPPSLEHLICLKDPGLTAEHIKILPKGVRVSFTFYGGLRDYVAPVNHLNVEITEDDCTVVDAVPDVPGGHTWH